MARLFTGIEIPPELQDRIAMLRAPLPGVRWIDAEDLHLTLRFAGDIDNRTADELADRLAAIDISTFEMRLSGLGAFGGRDPRNLWVGVEAGPELEAPSFQGERRVSAAVASDLTSGLSSLPEACVRAGAARSAGACSSPSAHAAFLRTRSSGSLVTRRASACTTWIFSAAPRPVPRDDATV